MAVNTHYRNNLEAVMQVNKNYTDTEIKKSEERILSIVARNNVDFIDHTDEATYRFTAPANAKLLMLQAIGGNTVKLSPSVASDSTKAMIKTMPSTVFTFDGSKFEGDSEVSENYLETVDGTSTNDGVTFVVNNKTVNVNNTATTGVFKTINTFTLNAGTYYFKSYGATGSNSTYFSYLQKNVSGTTTVLARSYEQQTFTLTETTTVEYLIAVRNGVNVPNVTFRDNILLYTGIHNLELSGLKVEGANLLNVNGSNTNGIYDSSGGIVSNPNWIAYNDYIELSIKEIILSYTFTTRGQFNIAQYNSSKTFISTLTYDVNSYTPFIPNLDSNCKYIRISYRSELMTNIMVNYGTTAKTYTSDYVAPTTIPIDLSTILYNGSPLFEGNSLKAVNDVKDSITPYLATKKLGYMDLGSLNWTYDSEYNRFIASIGNIKIVPTRTLQMLCSIYECKYNNEAFDSNWDMVIYNYGSSTTNIVIHNHNYTDATAFKTTMNGIYLVYELATPIEVSIDWSATLRNIQGYSNGSIIAENTYNMDVESVITYNSIIQETLCGSVTITRNGVDILTRNLPTQASDGWSAGTQRNYRVFCDDEGNEVSKRKTNVNKEDMGTPNWAYDSVNQVFNSSAISNIKIKTTQDTSDISCLCLAYDYEGVDYASFGVDMAFIKAINNDILRVKDIRYTNNAIFKNANIGNPLYYELADASKTETDMDDFDYFFDVEEGDVITFNNPYAQQVYATYSFLIKGAKSNE